MIRLIKIFHFNEYNFEINKKVKLKVFTKLEWFSQIKFNQILKKFPMLYLDRYLVTTKYDRE